LYREPDISRWSTVYSPNRLVVAPEQAAAALVPGAYGVEQLATVDRPGEIVGRKQFGAYKCFMTATRGRKLCGSAI
jgi:hypothetical protein